jgi:hypothetical protein
MAHVRRDCETLAGVPAEALRIAEVEDGSFPPFKLCRKCVPVFLSSFDSDDDTPTS